MNSALVSVAWLQAHIHNPDVLVLESIMKPVGFNPVTEMDGHIVGAVPMNIDTTFSDHQSPLPHTLLSEQAFQRAFRALGVQQQKTLIVYDRQGLYSAARAWWNIKLMGHQQVYILNGGLPAWVAVGGEIVAQFREQSKTGDFIATLQRDALIRIEELLTVLKQPEYKIIDARSSGRFAGCDPEPRAELRSGHMPGAVNLPFSECLAGGQLKPVDVLKQQFSQLGCVPDQPLIFTCGSGVTACIPLLAAYECGWRQLSLYDGAWCQWASSGQNIETSG